MSELVHQGLRFPVTEGDGWVNYITIEVAAPDGLAFIKVRALIDTGSDTTVIPASLIERLGADDVLPYLGDVVSETANGEIKEPTTKIALRIIGTDGQCTLFQGWPVVLSKTMDEPIFGMDLLRYFAIQIRHGQILSFTFDENSPSMIQKRARLIGK